MHLESRLEAALQQSPYLRGRQLRFETSDGHVTLRGVVGSFFHKQMAQEAIRVVAGVRRIDNFLEVGESSST